MAVGPSLAHPDAPGKGCSSSPARMARRCASVVAVDDDGHMLVGNSARKVLLTAPNARFTASNV